MGVKIHVARTEDEAASELKRIRAQTALAVAGCSRPRPRRRIVRAKQVQNIRLPQTRGAISEPLLVNQQRERDAGFFPELAGVVPIAESDDSERCSTLFERVLVFAQLRNVLAAENSAIVAQEDDHGWVGLPQRTQP
jgi:hypothetical protein